MHRHVWMAPLGEVISAMFELGGSGCSHVPGL